MSGISDAQASPKGKRTRVAIVGAGYVARFHLEVLAGRADVQTVAVCDLDRRRAAALAARWKIPHTVDTFSELQGLGVTIAHVLVPPDKHEEVAGQLLELGIGALIEKPMGLTPDGIERLGLAAAARNLPLGVNHNAVWHPALTRARALLDRGRIGRLEHVEMTMSLPLAQWRAGDFSHWMFRAPRNLVLEQAVHPLSQLHSLVGRVQHAQATVLGARTVRDGVVLPNRWSVAARGRHASATMYVSLGDEFPQHTLTLLGSDGSIAVDLIRSSVAIHESTRWLDFWDEFVGGWRAGSGLRRDAVAGLLRYASYTAHLGARRDPYFVSMRESIGHFHDAVREGIAPPADAHAALDVSRWCEAVAAALPAARLEPMQPVVVQPPRSGEIVVLGGTGTIGRRLVEQLLARSAHVTLIARRPRALPPALEAAAASGRLRVFSGSLEDPQDLNTAFAGADTVIHLATGGGETWDEIERAMVDGTIIVARAAMQAGVSKFVYVSSIAALYTPDAPRGDIDDTLGVDPRPEVRDIYSRGKAVAEGALQNLQRLEGLPLVIVRPGIVLGPDVALQHPGLGLWVRDNQCIGWDRGDHPIPLVTADDVADGLVRVAVAPAAAVVGQAMNLCSRVPLSARDVIDAAVRSSGRRITFHPSNPALSQAAEVGKWILKVLLRRPDASFPSPRDLKARAYPRQFTSRSARELLGWTPLEDPVRFLEAVLPLANRRDQEPSTT